MPSATTTRATMTSINVNPAERRHSMASVETFLNDIDLAVERHVELEAALDVGARHLDRERSDFAAREQHDLRLRILDVLRFEIRNQRHLAAVERERHRQQGTQCVRLEQAIVPRLGPLEALVV